MDALLHDKYSRFCPFPQVVIVKNSPAICKFFGTSYITSFSLMNCSNSFRLTSFFVPTNKTKGQLGERSISESYDRAMSEAAERIEKLQGAAVRVGYRKEDLKTTSFDVQTRYENVKDRQGNYKREFAGYA